VSSTSGEFAKYPDGQPIFPSDIVRYQCSNTACKFECRMSGSEAHVGRIVAVGKDYRHNANVKGIVKLQLQMLIGYKAATDSLCTLLESTGPPFRENELIVHEDEYLYLSESDISSWEKTILLDYQFQNGFSSCVAEPPDRYLIRRVINQHITSVRPLCLTTPPRGELEIATYGRKQLMDTFLPGRCLSFPYQLFIDGFGLYRNMYRSLIGIYIIPACLDAIERAKRNNVYPITLGPHGSNLADVISTLKRLSQLDYGIETEIHGKKTKLVAYAHMFLGDMPQQQDNAGFKRQIANRGCRQCLPTEEDHSNLEYDTVLLGRYHHQTVNIRTLAESRGQTAREKLLSEYGIAKQRSPLFQIAPSFNLITFFPSDPSHSEYAGMSKTALFFFLVGTILSPKGRIEYLSALRRFQFPSGWGLYNL
jgi:hypothetical protein